MDVQPASGPGTPSGEGGSGVHPSLPRDHAAPRVTLPLPAPRSSADHPDQVGCIGPAWIVREITHVPGVLRLADGRLCFTSTRGPVFDIAPADSDADLTLDRRARGGFRVTVGGERLRVHVVRPPGAVEPGAAFVDAVTGADDLPLTLGDPASAVTWRTALVGETVGPSRRSPQRRAGRVRRGSARSAPRS